MKKILLFLVLGSLSGSLAAQKVQRDKIFSLLYGPYISSFTGDTCVLSIQRSESGNYLRVDAFEHQAELRIWPFEQLTLVALTLTESDMVMSHQQAVFFLYRNGELEETQPLPTLYLSSFFAERYLEQKGVRPDQELPSPILSFSAEEENMTVHLQPESFDSTYMGNDELTRLDPAQMAVTSIAFLPDASGRFEISEKQYKVDGDLELNMVGGWECWCEANCSFMKHTKARYIFSNAMSRGGNQAVEMKYNADSAQVKERFIYAYGKRLSETEGIVFYDSTFVDGKKVNWYTRTSYQRVPIQPKNLFLLADKEPDIKTIQPLPIDKKTVEQAIQQKYPGTFAQRPNDDPELVRNQAVKLYPYAVEIEVTLYVEGKPIKKNLFFKIRHGEC